MAKWPNAVPIVELATICHPSSWCPVLVIRTSRDPEDPSHWRNVRSGVDYLNAEITDMCHLKLTLSDNPHGWVKVS